MIIFLYVQGEGEILSMVSRNINNKKLEKQKIKNKLNF